jgi:hypothetical protein
LPKVAPRERRHREPNQTDVVGQEQTVDVGAPQIAIVATMKIGVSTGAASHDWTVKQRTLTGEI